MLWNTYFCNCNQNTSKSDRIWAVEMVSFLASNRSILCLNKVFFFQNVFVTVNGDLFPNHNFMVDFYNEESLHHVLFLSTGSQDILTGFMATTTG